MSTPYAAFTESRRYLQIGPADASLEPETIQRAITDLHQTVTDDEGLFATTRYPTYEFLVAATGTTGDAGTRSLEWYVGVDHDRLEATRRTLTRCLPATYDIHETECSYADFLDLPSDDFEPAGTDADPDPDPGPDSDSEDALLEDWAAAGVEYHGVGDRPQDWQYPLEGLGNFAGAENSRPDWPLSRVFDGLAKGDAPTLLQVLVRPKPDWTYDHDARLNRLEAGADLWRHRLGNWLTDILVGGRESDHQTTRRATSTRLDGSSRRPANDTSRPQHGGSTPRPSPDQERDHLARSELERIEALEALDARQTFTVNARAIAFDTDADAADRTLRPLRNALTPLSTAHYRVSGAHYPYESRDADALLSRVLGREIRTAPKRRRHALPGVPNRSPAIVAAPGALGALCLTGGTALSSAARRALETTPQEKTGLELPPRATLNYYLDSGGMHVGHPRTANRETLDATASIPPAIQPLHTAVLGASGAGKSAFTLDMLLGNGDATDGANIYLDSKGDGGPDDYMRAHYASHGDLDDVYHFDCEDLLPAVSILSIESQLDAGIDRTQAVETVADRYLEIVAAYMGPERFESAPMAVDVIEALVKALFDPIHGADAVSQIDLVHAAARMHRSREPPTVTDPHLQEQLEATTANSPETFDSIMNAAIRRINQVTKDARLTPLFTHVATDSDDVAAFDFLDHLDERCTIVIDTSGYHDDPRQLLTITLISELWTALKRRQSLADPHDTLPQVNLFVEEAADIAAFDVLTDLLSKGRSFGIGVTTILQFPEQVRDDDPRVYRELLNDIGTHVTGPINDPGDLAKVFATSDHDVEAIATRISSLNRGEWLIRPFAPFGDDRPRPFICESRLLPPGHPDGNAPLSERDETNYQACKTLLESRMYRNYGVDVRESAPTPAEEPTAEADQSIDVDAFDHAFDTTIPHTERLPDCVTYRAEPPFPLLCASCETRYAPNTRGMRNAIACCHDLESVDRDDVPITNLDISLTATERHASDYSDAQLRLLAAVYMAHQLRFEADLEYDPVHDSMVRLHEYVGIDTDAVRDLLDDGLLKRDCTHPHHLYTLTPEGRSELEIGHREGVAHGDGQGDLSESSLHVAMIEAGCRYLRLCFVNDPESSAETIRRYYDLDDGRRLDAVALDADGTVVAALEAERSNNDTLRAVPDDFDKMADCDPDHAIWVVKNRAGAHDVLQALNDPPEGPTRVEKTYSENMRPLDFSIDTPGLTDVYTFQNLRDELQNS